MSRNGIHSPKARIFGSARAGPVVDQLVGGLVVEFRIERPHQHPRGDLFGEKSGQTATAASPAPQPPLSV